MDEKKIFIHYQHRKVDDAIDETLAEYVIPQLRNLIEAAAQRIIDRPGFEKSPFAKEFCGELLIKGLAGLLAISSFEDTETARMVMLEPRFVNWWFGLEDEE